MKKKKRHPFDISPEEASRIIKQEDPRYLTADRDVKRRDGKLICTLFVMDREDGKYYSLNYDLENPMDPFSGKSPQLVPNSSAF
jgi:hypothetical protein